MPIKKEAVIIMMMFRNEVWHLIIKGSSKNWGCLNKMQKVFSSALGVTG